MTAAQVSSGGDDWKNLPPNERGKIVWIPQDEFPEIDFVSEILGEDGNFHIYLQETFGVNIILRGQVKKSLLIFNYKINWLAFN